MAITYEWDARKASANLAKHGVDFDLAKDVFLDLAALIELDDCHSAEERWRLIGLAGGRVFLVVYTEPDSDVVRIILARKATKREEKAYFGQAPV
jgi:hypothetical protein